MPNQLKDQTSPYLLQHADNPVEWYAWSEAAFEHAISENKPVLLSIGYSACHWCHVMAHESFEDPATARVMNELFVNIKVDREERPDLDRIYQLSHQLLTQRPGGWPLTVFLTPKERMPFFAGTYFPRTPRHGMPAFADVLQQLAAFYHEHPKDLERQNEALADVYRRIEAGNAATDAKLTRQSIEQAQQLLAQEFDKHNGGFGGAPKFPQPTALALLMNAGLHGDEAAGRMALFSLQSMAERGLYDQIGGGFFRYCVDNAWQIPHFEKMLYDNATLLPLYAQAAAHSGDTFYKTIVQQTADWLPRDMQLSGGAWAASLDADNPEGEGAFYLWQRDTLKTLLDETTYQLVEEHYGLNQPPNHEDQWHLVRHQSLARSAEAVGLSKTQAQEKLAKAKAILLKERNKRTAPGRDDKILTAWNALMIHGLAKASILLNDKTLLSQAQTALQFIDENCWQGDQLYAVWTNGKVRQTAFLDDVASLLQATMTMLQADWKIHWLNRAQTLADILLTQFIDTQNGGFFFTPKATSENQQETLIHRPKTFADESLPSGNAIAAKSLLRLGWLLGETRYLDAAEHCLQAGHTALTQAPHAQCSLLMAQDDYLDPPPQIILRGKPATMQSWRQQLSSTNRAEIYSLPEGEKDLPDVLQAHQSQGDCVAYVCRGTHCETPLFELDALKNKLI